MRTDDHDLLTVLMLYGSCHNGMRRLRIADARDSIEIWRVAANMLNNQSYRAKKGWSYTFGVGRGGDICSRQLVTKCHIGPRNWTDILERPSQ
jgi:hypothetical protein